MPEDDSASHLAMMGFVAQESNRARLDWRFQEGMERSTTACLRYVIGGQAGEANEENRRRDRCAGRKSTDQPKLPPEAEQEAEESTAEQSQKEAEEFAAISKTIEDRVKIDDCQRLSERTLGRKE